MSFLPYATGILPNVLIQVLPIAIAGILALVRARNARAPALVRSAGILLLITAVLYLITFVTEIVLFMNIAAYVTSQSFRIIAVVSMAREGVTLLLVVALVLLLIAITFAKQPRDPAGAAPPGYGPPDPRYGAQQPGYGADPGQQGRSSWDINNDAGGGPSGGGRDRGWDARF